MNHIIMNKILKMRKKTVSNLTILLFLCIIIMTACKGKDRSTEYEDLTAHNTWMLSVMQDKYLWGDRLTEQTYKAYFYTSTKFFSTLVTLADNDSWSYCLVDSAVTDPHARGNFDHLNSYGIDFTVVTDPTKATSRSLARVTYIVENSPASKAGLSRNTFISSIDDTKVTSSNATNYLVNGSSHEIVFHHLDTLDTGEYVWTDTVYAALPASQKVVEPAFPVVTIIDGESSKIAYLMSTRLVPYPDESTSSGTEFQDDMDAKMKDIIAEKPDELILDLRLCNYGTIEMACRLASYIVPTASKDDVFAKTIWNSRYSSNNTTYTYDKSLPSLELSRVYIIIGNQTQGAAEWLVRGLIQTLGSENVILVGDDSKGQNVMTQFVAAGYGHKLYPAVCYVTDATGTTSYDALTETHNINENSTNYWLEMKDFGNPEEQVFAYTLSIISNE